MTPQGFHISNWPWEQAGLVAGGYFFVLLVIQVGIWVWLKREGAPT